MSFLGFKLVLCTSFLHVGLDCNGDENRQPKEEYHGNEMHEVCASFFLELRNRPFPKVPAHSRRGILHEQRQRSSIRDAAHMDENDMLVWSSR